MMAYIQPEEDKLKTQAATIGLSEDSCDVIVEGKRCGQHLGYGREDFHLRDCGEHEDEEAVPEVKAGQVWRKFKDNAFQHDLIIEHLIGTRYAMTKVIDSPKNARTRIRIDLLTQSYQRCGEWFRYELVKGEEDGIPKDNPDPIG